MFGMVVYCSYSLSSYCFLFFSVQIFYLLFFLFYGSSGALTSFRLVLEMSFLLPSGMTLVCSYSVLTTDSLCAMGCSDDHTRYWSVCVCVCVGYLYTIFLCCRQICVLGWSLCFQFFFLVGELDVPCSILSAEMSNRFYPHNSNPKSAVGCFSYRWFQIADHSLQMFHHCKFVFLSVDICVFLSRIRWISDVTSKY